jgi:hypothetical protein
VFVANRSLLEAVPVSFFKSISITFGGAGLIFEGLERSSGCRNGTFCKGFLDVNPQRSDQGMPLRNLFWDTLLKKETGTANIYAKGSIFFKEPN